MTPPQLPVAEVDLDTLAGLARLVGASKTCDGCGEVLLHGYEA